MPTVGERGVGDVQVIGTTSVESRVSFRSSRVYLGAPLRSLGSSWCVTDPVALRDMGRVVEDPGEHS